MKCPECNEKTTVLDTRRAPQEVYRHRKCTSCGHTFYTVEYEVEDDEKFKKEYRKYYRARVRYLNKIDAESKGE